MKINRIYIFCVILLLTACWQKKRDKIQENNQAENSNNKELPFYYGIWETSSFNNQYKFLIKLQKPKVGKLLIIDAHNDSNFCEMFFDCHVNEYRPEFFVFKLYNDKVCNGNSSNGFVEQGIEFFKSEIEGHLESLKKLETDVIGINKLVFRRVK